MFNNKKTILLLLLTVFSLSTLTAQNLEELKVQALSDAKITAKAMMNSNFDQILDYTHPAVIEKMGGKEVFLPQIETAFSEMKKQGVSFVSATANYASDVVKEQGEYRCYVENTNIIKMGESTIKSTSYLLGFYLEDKSQWVFIEAEKIKNQPVMDMFFTDFKTSIDIPNDVMETVE